MGPRTIVFAALLALAALLAWGRSSLEAPPAAPDRATLPASPAALAETAERAQPAATSTASAATGAPEPTRTAVAEASTDRRLCVRVVDADRQPIENAEVETFEDSTPGVTRTDRDGYAALPGPMRGDARRLFVRAGNRHAQAYWQFREDLTITLRWAGPLRGRIVDRATGTTIAGAVVTRHHGYCKHCEADRAVADTNGWFELPAVPRDEDCVFVFNAEGYARQHERLRLPGKADPLTHTFSLQRGVAIAGRCVDVATRRPLAGTRIVKEGEPLAESATDGSFRVLVLPESDGTVPLRFEHGGYCWVTHTVQTPQLDPAVEYPLLRAATITGRVVDPNRIPIDGARVRAMPAEAEVSIAGMPPDSRVQAEGYIRRSTTDASGTFAMDGLVPGWTFRLRAGHEDYELPRDERRMGSLVEAKEGAPPCELVLVPKQPTNGLGTVAGTFRCNGESRGGRLSWSWESRRGSAAIDEAGNFRCEKVPAGCVQVVVTPRAFEHAVGETADAVQWRGSVDVVADQEVRLDIEHQLAEATITGRITLADGTAVAGRTVWGTEGIGARLLARSGDDGTYSLRVPQALARLKVSCDGAASSREVGPGTTGCDFVVARRGTLRVRIRHEDGARADAQVARISANGSVSPLHLASAPDQDGFIAIELEEGWHTFLFVDRGHSPCVRAVNVVGTTSLEVTLVRGVPVTLRLHAEAEPRSADLGVRVIDEGLPNSSSLEWAGLWRLERRTVQLTREGASVQALAPGTHRLVSQDPDIELEPSTFELGAAPVTIDVKWRRRGK